MVKASQSVMSMFRAFTRIVFPMPRSASVTYVCMGQGVGGAEGAPSMVGLVPSMVGVVPSMVGASS